MQFSSEATLVMNSAMEIAQKTGGMIYGDHILYGLASIPNTIPYQVLIGLGITPERVQSRMKFTGITPRTILSQRAKHIVNMAIYYADQGGYNVACPEHIFYALLKDPYSDVGALLQSCGGNVEIIVKELSELIFGGRGKRNDGIRIVIKSGDSPIKKIIEDFIDQNDNLNEDEKTQEDVELDNAIDNLNKFFQDPKRDIFGKGSTSNKQKNKEESVLDGLGVDLVTLAEEGKLDPVIGREKEIDRIIEILCRRTKNNPVIIGDPGVGKTAVVNGLANAIAQKKVPEAIANKRIFSLDVASLVAGTKYRGEFEERLKNAINEIKKRKDIIIFIDEIHMIMKAGDTEGGSMTMGNIIKPELSRGEMQTIGATTVNEYRKFIEKDEALERRFQPIMLTQPSVYDTIEILKGIKDKYEEHHGVKIKDDAIEAAATLSDRYISDRFLPDKAIDLIDEAAAKKRNFSFVVPAEVRDMEEKIKEYDIKIKEAVKHELFNEAELMKHERDEIIEQKEKALLNWEQNKDKVELTIGEEEVAKLVSEITNIPVTKITQSEGEKVANLENVLKKRVIGQDEAVETISRAIKRSRAGLQNPKRPIGSFILLGPTGVGKTELSKALAEALFGDEKALIRVDMSEYMEQVSVTKLIGSDPGYVGYEEGGQLTEKVRRQPYSVILFDEIEKAHPDVFNIMLQILDDGRLTDNHGRTINFKNTVIILTSNIGASEINKSRLGFGAKNEESEYEDMKQRQLDALKKVMKPEFINRLDDILIFHRLSKDSITKIAHLMIDELAKRLKEQGIYIDITGKAIDFLVSQGYNEEYGARPLRRAIQKHVEDKLSDMVLRCEITAKDKLLIDYDGTKLTYTKK